MLIDWHQYHAAIWRTHSQKLKPIERLDPVRLAELKGIEKQKQALLDNTRHFVEGKTSNHAILWGARGTGKSSLIKAMLNELAMQGLRMIQVDKDDLSYLPEILDYLEEADDKFRFVIF